jgi:hypothetical protein
MYCTGVNSKGSSCGNTVAHGKYCAWHVPESKVDKRTKPLSKKTTSKKTTSKTIQQQAHEIQQIIYSDKAHNPSQHTIVNEVTVAVYGHLFPTK